MPDAKGLTDDERMKIKKWFEDKWKEPVICPICKGDTWILADDIVTPVIYGEKGPILGGATYPQVMVVCNKCGLTLYLNALIMGIVRPKEEADGKK